MKLQFSLLLSGLLFAGMVSGSSNGSGASATPDQGSSEYAPIISLDEVERGQRGWGLSVFAGQSRERFEFEVLGVVRNTSPGQDYVVARLSGQGLEHSGIIAGMSGSPVYIGDRLLGAVAYSWAFAKDPIAGITPIASMRAIGAGGAAGGGLGDALRSATPAPSVYDLLHQRDAVSTLHEAFEQLRPSQGSQTAPAVGWGITGFPTSIETQLTRSLGPLAPIGAASEAVSTDNGVLLPPGSSVAAVLVDGDLRLAATGTVTDRIGEDVLAFGHPFYSLGEISVPMAESEIITVMPSAANSFKIASLGKTIGAFHQDRQPGVRGTLGVEAQTTPMVVTVHVPEPQRYTMRLARIPQLTAALAAVATLGAQGSASTTIGPMGLDLSVRFDLGSHGVLALEQSFDGLTAASEAAMFVLGYVNFFLQNAFDEVVLHGLEIDIYQHPEPRTAILVGGYADRTKVRPGQEVNLNLEFVPYRGEVIRHRLPIRVPQELPAGRYSLLVGDGVTIDLQRAKVEPASPVRLEQALEIVEGFHSRRDLVVLGLHSGRGLAVAGEVLPQLPGSMQSLWTSAASKSAVPLRLVVAQESSQRLEVPIAGGVRIDLEVVRPDPVTAQDPDASDSGGEGGSEGQPSPTDAATETVARGVPLGA